MYYADWNLAKGIFEIPQALAPFIARIAPFGKNQRNEIFLPHDGSMGLIYLPNFTYIYLIKINHSWIGKYT